MLKIISMVFATFMLASSVSAAPVGDEPSEEDKVQARRYFSRGEKLFRRGRFSQAVEAFEKAYQFWGRREIHFNIAFSYARLNEPVRAVTHLRKFLRAASEPERRKIPPLLRKMQQSVGVLIIRVPSEEARIYVDGRDEGSGHVEIVVETGMRMVEIRHGGKTVAKNEMDAEPGIEKIWELTELPGTEPEPRPDPEPQPRPDPVPDPVRPPIVEEPPSRGLHWAYFTATAGLAVVAAGVAGGTGFKTNSLRKDYEDNPTRSTMDKGNTMRRVTNAMWGVSAGFAVGATVLAIFTEWRKPTQRIIPGEGTVNVIPSITDRGAAVNVVFRR